MQSLNQLHRQAKNGSDSRHEEEGRTHERRDKYRRTSHSISSRGTHRHHSPPYSTRKFYASEDSISNPKVSLVRNQRRRHELEGSLSHHPFMVKEKENMMSNPGCLESKSIFSCKTTHLT